MRWQLRVVIGAAGAALLLPAAGSSASADALDEDELRQALLDHMDFPEDWAVDSAEAEQQRGIGVPTPQDEACGGLFDSSAPTTASTGFARSFSGPFVTTTAAGHGGEEEARAAMEDFRRAGEECDSFESVEGAGHGPSELTVVYRSGEADTVTMDDSVADEVASVRFEREQESEQAPEVLAEAALVRVGEHTVMVAQAGRDDPGTGDLKPMVERAVEKLQDVADGRTPEPPSGISGTDL
ncbi:hypothetical protein [Streptomyces otsuchiensis]|uniref:hypothetical protein n=1 Tax=Streptomyces otsuchiensis TaxID=2681388 RepID=UPI0010306D41|nr:hypothetical protein [Streptomyces otsuchiensis]